ncbi:hypothetical protein CTI14_63845, partial [Methylobacterium radiotolerans]
WSLLGWPALHLPTAHADNGLPVGVQWVARTDEDFIVTPSAPSEAPEGTRSTGSSLFNRVWSLLGWPALHLPTAHADNGLPVGVQWVARTDE